MKARNVPHHATGNHNKPLSCDQYLQQRVLGSQRVVVDKNHNEKTKKAFRDKAAQVLKYAGVIGSKAVEGF